MDPPPLPPLPTTAAHTTINTAPTATATTIQLNYQDSSMESSPCSRAVEASLNEPLSSILGGGKLRLMCSYGGHIIPRPHDKSLCYVGGETRLVVVDRHSSLSSFHSRLSRTLLNNHPFTLKYQLPNEDLDSLISITTDEDLDNMIEEYDRSTSTSPLKPSRLRLFLFAAKPETSTSMGSLLDDAKSETWFVDALNGSGLLPRGLSDSTMDCLLNLDEVRGGSDSCNDLEAQAESLSDNKQVNLKNVHEVHLMPDSPMVVESSSSFGSSSSSPSMSNLPPIRVRVEEQKVGIEEQFAKLSLAPPPPLPTALAAATMAIPTAGSSENLNRGFSDDERSDQGVPVGIRKPPLPLQPLQHKADAGFSLPSPDSVASNSSIASANSFSKPMFYQDSVHAATKDNRVHSPTPKSDHISDPGTRIQMQQVQDSSYIFPPQFDQQHQQQQQFVHASSHFIPHPATGPVTVSSYYPMYAPQAQQQYHYPIDQQYPVYVMPISQTQPYNMSMQSNMADTTVVASSRSLTPPNPAMIASSAAYKDGIPPIYPTKTGNPAKPEIAASVYQTAVTAAPPLVQVPSNQFQQQYMGIPQMQHPQQSTAVAPPASANYGFEYGHPAHHDQVYYTQHPAAPLPPQYQTMTPAAAAAIALSDASKQLPTDNTKHQIKASKPL